MIGFNRMNLLPGRIYYVVFTLLVQALVFLIAILKECRFSWIYLLKEKCLYILTILVFFTSAPSVECTSFSFTFYEEMATSNRTGIPALNLGAESYSSHGVLGPLTEHPLYRDTIYCYNVHVVDRSRACLEFSEI